MICAVYRLLLLPLLFDVSGFVRDGDGQPIEGARVRVQTDLGEPVVTGPDGAFLLPLASGTDLTITAAVPYNPHASVNYVSAGTGADNGDSGVVVVLPTMPTTPNTDYFPIKARTPDGCGDCHPLHLEEWEASRHADTAQNTWVTDLYADWSAQNPGQTGFCAGCHAPAADAMDPGNVFLDQIDDLPILERLSAREGVHCSACHQIDHVNDQVQALHLSGNATMRFPLDGIAGSGTHDYVWGPLDDVAYPFMKAAYSAQFQSSTFCATCHEYENPNNGVPAQTTFSEWEASPYASSESGVYADCQACHMTRAEGVVSLCDPPPGFGNGPPRDGAAHASHAIAGTTAAGLAAAVTVTPSVDVDDGLLRVTVDVANLGAGHDFPTGISLRNVLLRVSASALGADLPQTSGGTIPFYGSDDDGTPDAGDWAGLPGKGYAKVLVGPGGAKPVLFIDAVAIESDTRIPAGTTDRTTYGFQLAGADCDGTLDVAVTLAYRRAWRALAVAQGWTTDNRGLPWDLTLHDLVLPLTADDLRRAMWADAVIPNGYDTNGDGRIDIRDLLLGCTR